MSTSASVPTTSDADDLSLLFGPQSAAAFPTDALVSKMLDAGSGISDLVFSPGRPPQVEQHGELTAVMLSGLEKLTAAHTAVIARHLVGGQPQAVRTRSLQVRATGGLGSSCAM